MKQKQIDCSVCGKKLRGQQTKTCSVKCRRKYLKMHYENRGMEKIISALRKLKGRYVSSRTVRKQAGNMDYGLFKRLFRRIIKNKIVDSLPTERWVLYRLNEEQLYEIERGN